MLTLVSLRRGSHLLAWAVAMAKRFKRSVWKIDKLTGAYLGIASTAMADVNFRGGSVTFDDNDVLHYVYGEMHGMVPFEGGVAGTASCEICSGHVSPCEPKPCPNATSERFDPKGVALHQWGDVKPGTNLWYGSSERAPHQAGTRYISVVSLTKSTQAVEPNFLFNISTDSNLELRHLAWADGTCTGLDGKQSNRSPSQHP